MILFISFLVYICLNPWSNNLMLLSFKLVASHLLFIQFLCFEIM